MDITIPLWLLATLKVLGIVFGIGIVVCIFLGFLLYWLFKDFRM